MLWFMIGFKFSFVCVCACACACVCVFNQYLFVGRGKNETFLIWKVAYENCRLVQPDSEDFLSTLKVKMPQNNLPALAKIYYFLFKHNKMQAESQTLGIQNVFLWKWFTSKW